jgi:hypothetical protein
VYWPRFGGAFSFLGAHGADQRGNNRAARRFLYFVIAGLDPAIHAERRLIQNCRRIFYPPVSMDHRIICDKTALRAFCPVVTKKKIRLSRVRAAR